jgi:2,3-dimethylmalate lyase
LQLVYRNLKDAGIGTGSQAPMMPFAEMNNLMGFPSVHAFEKRYGLAKSDHPT